MKVFHSYSLSILICFFLMQGTAYHVTISEFLSGMAFNVPQGGMPIAMALMGSVGVTAAELFFYPYLLKEKGYGANVGARSAGKTEAWALRQKGWMNVLKTDTLICTIIAAVITAAYYLVAASVFHNGLGSVPTGIGVVEGLAGMFTESVGKWSYGLFMFGAFCTLYSTLLIFHRLKIINFILLLTKKWILISNHTHAPKTINSIPII